MLCEREWVFEFLSVFVVQIPVWFWRLYDIPLFNVLVIAYFEDNDEEGAIDVQEGLALKSLGRVMRGKEKQEIRGGSSRSYSGFTKARSKAWLCCIYHVDTI